MMAVLFRPLEEHLKELATFAIKNDSLNALTILVICEEISDRNESRFVSSIITNLQSTVRLAFNEFIDNEANWISSMKASAKRSGVLPPFVKFPSFVERMENVITVQQAQTSKETSSTSPSPSTSSAHQSHSADTTYQKLCSVLFKLLEHTASKDEKYADLVFVENLHFFLTSFTTFNVVALQSPLQRAQTLYTTHLMKYINWNIEYELSSFSKFFSRLEDAFRTMSPEDVQFVSDLTKTQLRDITKNILPIKNLQKSITNIRKRIEKHLPKNPILITEIWQKLSETLVGRLRRLEQLIALCYPGENMTVNVDEVADICNKFANGTLTTSKK
jgi:hypothetical protein